MLEPKWLRPPPPTRISLAYLFVTQTPGEEAQPPLACIKRESSQTVHTRDIAYRYTRGGWHPTRVEVREEIQFLLFLPNHVIFGELRINMNIIGTNVEALRTKT